MSTPGADIRLLVMDVDGVLTDGIILRGNEGEELRAFHVHDGLGIELWHLAGGMSGIITSKSSAAVKRRAQELKITCLVQNARPKTAAFERMLRRLGLAPAQVCYIGDDLIDIAVMKTAGFSVTVPDAPAEVKRVAQYVTSRHGGRGAVRETVEYILKAQRRWDAVAQRFEG